MTDRLKGLAHPLHDADVRSRATESSPSQQGELLGDVHVRYVLDDGHWCVCCRRAIDILARSHCGGRLHAQRNFDIGVGSLRFSVGAEATAVVETCGSPRLMIGIGAFAGRP
jgi:hypothetical protein